MVCLSRHGFFVVEMKGNGFAGNQKIALMGCRRTFLVVFPPPCPSVQPTAAPRIEMLQTPQRQLTAALALPQGRLSHARLPLGACSMSFHPHFEDR
jgi:hypothetical protein